MVAGKTSNTFLCVSRENSRRKKMTHTQLHIKNMVCNRCIKVVKEELERLHFEVKEIKLGRVILNKNTNAQDIERIKETLEAHGFELMSDKRSQLIDQIKSHLIEAIHHSPELLGERISSPAIARKLGYDYSYLSTLFSSHEGITIEKYIINQKIEKIKELLTYGELSIKEIAYQLNYSSAQHLSNQFKKITSYSPSDYKQLKQQERRPLDEV